MHDALCVIRCLVKQPAILAGGGAPEIQMSQQLEAISRELSGVDSYCFKAYANALEVSYLHSSSIKQRRSRKIYLFLFSFQVIPSTLAENAGLNPIATVTELRKRHHDGEIGMGINVRKGTITRMSEEDVIQPLLVSTSAITLATETVRSILKIDDIVNTMN